MSNSYLNLEKAQYLVRAAGSVVHTSATCTKLHLGGANVKKMWKLFLQPADHIDHPSHPGGFEPSWGSRASSWFTHYQNLWFHNHVQILTQIQPFPSTIDNKTLPSHLLLLKLVLVVFRTGFVCCYSW